MSDKTPNPSELANKQQEEEQKKVNQCREIINNALKEHNCVLMPQTSIIGQVIQQQVHIVYKKEKSKLVNSSGNPIED